MHLPYAKSRASILHLLGLALLAATAGCGTALASQVTGAPRVPPDEEYSTGGGVLYRGLSWRCVDGAHVVMTVTCYDGFPGGCDDWKIERVPCGTRTPIEERSMPKFQPWSHGNVY